MKTEKELIDDIMNLMKLASKQSNPDYKTKSRVAHAKTIGLLKAQFHVSKTIPNKYRLGVFASPKSFDTWIRFSNGSGNISSDNEKDVRSLSMKIMNVKGERLTNDRNSQDFILVSSPTFAFGTLENFRDAIHYIIKYKKYRLSKFMLTMNFLLTGRINILKDLKKFDMKTHDSLLNINYWSQTPYKIGDFKVKYIIKSTTENVVILKKDNSDNFLRKNISKHLSSKSATFDFFIQPFINERTTPTDDVSIIWDEKISKPIKMGKLEIPIQEFDTRERMNISHNMSFAIGNTLREHKPIGPINRARIEIYEKMANLRMKANNSKMIEPTFDECK